MFVFGNKDEHPKILSDKSAMLKTTHRCRNRGVILDSKLKSKNCNKAETKSAFYHLKNISR